MAKGWRKVLGKTLVCGHENIPENLSHKGEQKYKRCKVCSRLYARKWRDDHPGWDKFYDVMDRNRLLKPRLKAQKNKCAICLRVLTTPYIDHDHRCKRHKVTTTCKNCRRGLLCPACNAALHLVENKVNLERAIKYLRKWEKWRLRNKITF